jgi:putative methionine-R-sulfoxide reductase with GAF domain
VAPARQVLPAAKKIVPDEKDKPRLDEQTFGRLLEAAYVLQEHSRELRKLERHLELRRDQLSSPEIQALEASSQADGRLAVASEEQFSAPIRAHQSTAPVQVQPSAPQSAQQSSEEHFSPESAPSPPVSLESIDEIPAQAPPAGPQPSKLAPTGGYTGTLAQIVQTQHQIRARHLELENSMSLVAERVTEIAKAGGAAIGFLDATKSNVRYRGVAGRMTLPAGSEVTVGKALCAASLRTGQVIRCADVNPEFLFDPEECRRRGIQALIAVPIFHEGGIVGALELYYATTQAFTEQDVHTCQLMAGLITEALAREDELGWKKSLASERAVMLEALERLKPNLAALTDTPSARVSPVRNAASRTPDTATVPSTPAFVCRKCGHHLMGQELFCGKCGSRRGSDRSPDHSEDHGVGRSADRSPDQGAVRRSDYDPPSMQSKLASLREVQEAIKNSAVALPANGGTGHVAANHVPSDLISPELVAIPFSDPARPEKPLADSIEEEMPELFAAPELRSRNMSGPEELRGSESSIPILASQHEVIVSPELGPQQDGPQAEEHEPQAETALVKPTPEANWSSASTAREFLEQLAAVNNPGTLARFWRARRGDIYLGIAVILVAAVVRWGIWSNHSVNATGKPTPAAAGHRNPAPDADLSAFDRMLISLGLADPPPAPEYKGNPETQVWVDLHTALYYCPGTDLYGKTPKGKFTSQRDAQLDQFEPAYRKACD